MAGIGGYEVSNALLGLLAALAGAYIYGVWPYSYWRSRGIKGPKMYPFVGDLVVWVRKGMQKKMLDDVRTYGRVHGSYTMRIPTLVAADAEIARQVCVKQADKFTDRAKLRHMPRPLSSGITVLRGREWRRVRNLVTPSFSTGRIRGMFGLIEDAVGDLLERLGRHADQGETFEPKTDFSNFTMDVIARTLFAMRINTHSDPNNPFKTHADRLFKISLRSPKLLLLVALPRLVGPIYKFFNVSVFSQETLDFFFGHIRAALEQRRSDSNEYHDFLASCVEAMGAEGDKSLSEDEVIAQCFTLFLAGFETTANAMQFCAYLLATHQECQDRCRAEVKQAGPLTYESVQSLRYLNQCISESLRLFPPVSMIDRLCNTDTTVCGYEIEAGTAVRIPVYCMARDPDVWGDDADQFKPERFDPELGGGTDSMYFLPFGLGPRNCIGMRLAQLELRKALAELLLAFRLLPDCDTPTLDKLELASIGITAPKVPIKLRVERLD